MNSREALKTPRPDTFEPVGRGRLYSVPVEMGWRAQPVAEADLNPHLVFA